MPAEVVNEKADKTTISTWDPAYLKNIETEIVDLFGYKFAILKHERISAQIKRQGIYESANTRLMPALLNIGGDFLDIGANIGYYTMWMSRLGTQQSTVHSFEPNPFTYSILRGNVDRNNLSHVSVNNMAVGKEAGSLQIDLDLALPNPEIEASDYNLGAWSLTKKKPGSHEVRVTSIDEYVQERKLLNVKFIKIDVEGYERQVLMGAKDTLKAMRPSLLIEIASPNERRKEQIMYIMEFLKTRKYSLAYVERKPFPHMRQLRPEDTEGPTFRFYVFACRMNLDFLGT